MKRKLTHYVVGGVIQAGKEKEDKIMAGKLQPYLSRMIRFILPIAVLLLWALPLLAGEHGGSDMGGDSLHTALWIGSIIYRAVLIVLVFLIYKEVKARK